MSSEKALQERRKSCEGCTTTSTAMQGRPSGKQVLFQPLRKRRSRGRKHLSFSSVLISHFSGSEDIGKALQAAFPLQADWLQQAVGTVNNAKHLLAGALSAVLSKTATAPLERIKMEMQLKQRSSTIAVAQRLLHEGGYPTFWQGNGMNLLRVTPHKAVNFYSFYLYRTALKKAFGHMDSRGVLRFLAGAMAGSTATLTCFPLDVIRTRMLSYDGDTQRSALGTLKEETFASLYVGCLPAIVSTAASGAIFYGVYDVLKERYVRRRQERDGSKAEDVVLSAGRTMLYGALAGAAAETILYPLEVLRRRMQLQSMQATEVMLGAQKVERLTLAAATENGAFAQAGNLKVPVVHQMAAAVIRKPHFRKLINASVEIYKVEGLLGFYQGFAPHILQVLPSAALSYYFYEACKRALKVEE